MEIVAHRRSPGLVRVDFVLWRALFLPVGSNQGSRLSPPDSCPESCPGSVQGCVVRSALSVVYLVHDVEELLR